MALIFYTAIVGLSGRSGGFTIDDWRQR